MQSHGWFCFASIKSHSYFSVSAPACLSVTVGALTLFLCPVACWCVKDMAHRKWVWMLVGGGWSACDPRAQTGHRAQPGEEAGGLRAGPQPEQAISLLLARLVSDSAPCPFLSYPLPLRMCVGNAEMGTSQRSTMGSNSTTGWENMSWCQSVVFCLKMMPRRQNHFYI